MCCLQSLLLACLDARPKVRKAAQSGLTRACGALQGSAAASLAGDAVLRCEPKSPSYLFS